MPGRPATGALEFGIPTAPTVGINSKGKNASGSKATRGKKVTSSKIMASGKTISAKQVGNATRLTSAKETVTFPFTKIHVDYRN